MPHVDLRIFRFAITTNAKGIFVATDVCCVDECQMEVRLADVVSVNGLAAHLRPPYVYDVVGHELRLLQSYLPDDVTGPLCLRADEFRASSSHIRRFVTESFGLGMLTAAVERQFRWRLDDRSLEHFDLLPTSLFGSGVRLDLLFQFDGGGHPWLLAGEARGRSEKRTVRGKPGADQRERLDEIAGWSARHGFRPVTMAWAYTGACPAQVDLFVLDSMYKDRSTAPPPSPERGFEDERRSPAGEHSSARLAHLAEQELRTAQESLYRTAPHRDPLPVFDRQVRGQWARADLLGPSSAHLFLGILDHELGPQQIGAVRQRNATFSPGRPDPIQVDVMGRMMLAVALNSDAQPAWREVTERLL